MNIHDPSCAETIDLSRLGDFACSDGRRLILFDKIYILQRRESPAISIAHACDLERIDGRRCISYCSVIKVNQKILKLYSPLKKNLCNSRENVLVVGSKEINSWQSSMLTSARQESTLSFMLEWLLRNQ